MGAEVLRLKDDLLPAIPQPTQTTPLSDSSTSEAPGGSRFPPPVELYSPTAEMILEVHLKTFEPEGVLTLYADEVQILSKAFDFQGQKRGILGRRKAAGTLESRERIPADTRVLRVYLLVGTETKQAILEGGLSGPDASRLEILLNRKGDLEAKLR